MLTTRDGRTHTFDYVICAVGAGRPADHYELTGSAGYFGDPSPLRDTVAAIPADADVTVLGTGLAAVLTVAVVYNYSFGRLLFVLPPGYRPAGGLINVAGGNCQAGSSDIDGKCRLVLLVL